MSIGENKGPEPRLRPTSAATLFVAGLAAAAVAWLSISFWYWDILQLPWLPAVTMLALAVFEFVLAVQTKARIERKPGRPPVEPLAVARYVVLAKASSLAGAIFLGFTAAVTVWLVVKAQRNDAAGADLPTAILSVIASLALVGAALWLERACRVPEQPDSKDTDQTQLRP
ncbi:DUF3180 domain-containing protein [Allorhizocola rhizosphaerae]|uniref:DUF3180 domain-containing protein n=1 Tax=Allorhizocola rhizosphaerae TaxID=1872709 RepID=UPI000E3EBAF2|nr:DUF3180 domain-containing protein [Allorhizocola rhizosphaerae]